MGYLAQVLDKTIAGILRPRQKQAEKRPSCACLRAGAGDELSIKEAERIVNEYGIALENATYLNRIEVTNLLNELASGKESIGKVSRSLLKGEGKYHDLLTMRCEKSLLPYPKKTIQDAIDLLLQHETDPENIKLLQEGLCYLERFSR